MPGRDGWREGHRRLTSRAAAIPALLRQTLAAPPPHLPFDPARARRVVTTGVGSSAAHARLLAILLQEVGLDARFVPLSAFATAPSFASRADALVVFSQGLSPNARLALHDPAAWAGVLLVTGVPQGDAAPSADRGDVPPSGALAARQRLLEELVERGVVVHRVPAAEEYGTLLRLTGPMIGVAAAIVLARNLAAAAGRSAAGLLPVALPIDDVCARVAGAAERLAREHADLDADALEDGLAFLASGVYGELVANLRAKVLEGMLLREPPVWDLLAFAHGPFQQTHQQRVTLLALTRADAPGEDDLLTRLDSMLVAGRQRLVRLESSLPGALALLEHEALLNALVLRYVAERAIDQCDWPGRGADGALYAVERALSIAGGGARVAARAPDVADLAAAVAPDPAAAAGSPTTRTPSPGPHRLDRLTWPDVAALLASGARTALLPLGSTEQHGPHLPLATDTLIAEAVAARVCARSDAIQLPVVPLGCASEHMSFAGTLSLAESTLEAVLRDVGAALARHGFARLLVFSAHGGNAAVLRAAAARVAPDLAPLRVEPFCELDALRATLDGVSARFGIRVEDAGQHAGELETSILLGIAPALVRRERAQRGLTDTALSPEELFYPDLRRHAADGTVGDPRAADAARADAYLDAWATLLLAAWSDDAKKRK